MKRTFYFFSLIFTIAPFMANGQGCDGLIKDARVLVKNLKFDEAIKKVEAAKGCALQAEIDKLYLEIFAGLKKQTAEAIKAKERAEKAEERLREQQKNLEFAFNKLLSYGGYYVLTSEGKYGIMSKGELLGKKKAPQNVFIYDMASNFNDRSFLKAEKKTSQGITKYFLVDTNRVEYPLATNVKDLNDTITALDLRGQNFASVPEEVFRYKKLKVLIMDKIKIKELSSNIGMLTNLEYLSMWENDCTSFPSEIGKLSKLHTLDLGGWATKKFPKEIWGLKNLRVLSIWGNPLEEGLPSEIGQLQNLEYLYLYHSSNKLNKLPDEISNLKKLKELSLNVNNFNSFPPQLLNLTNLEKLDMSSNPLGKIPPQISQLKKIQHLNLGDTGLTDLPVEIGKLTSLRYLNLTSNRIPLSAQEKIKKLLPTGCEVKF